MSPSSNSSGSRFFAIVRTAAVVAAATYAAYKAYQIRQERISVAKGNELYNEIVITNTGATNNEAAVSEDNDKSKASDIEKSVEAPQGNGPSNTASGVDSHAEAMDRVDAYTQSQQSQDDNVREQTTAAVQQAAEHVMDEQTGSSESPRESVSSKDEKTQTEGTFNHDNTVH